MHLAEPAVQPAGGGVVGKEVISVMSARGSV